METTNNEDLTFLRTHDGRTPRNEPWPERPSMLLLLHPEPERLTSWRAALVATALLITFVAGYAYGVVVTRRAVAVEASRP